MLDLCIDELSRVVGGETRLGLMPPLAGHLEPIRRIVVDSAMARPGDVYWALVGAGFDGARTAEEAFARGALGVVTSSRPIEPWAGKFVVRVPNANQALCQLAEHERLRYLGRRCKPVPFHAGDTTGMVAAMLRGDKIAIEDLVHQMSRRPACAVL
jgi:UDP-N-acetylmuramyl pentapeptide synthase